MTPYLLATSIRFEAGGPNATPRSKKFKVGIPYVYAIMFEMNISRDARPPRDTLQNPFADNVHALEAAYDAQAQALAAEADSVAAYTTARAPRVAGSAPRH